MNYNKRNTPSDPDDTGAIVSWVIIFILMFAFPPVGLLLLILKLRSYAKPVNSPVQRKDAHSAAAVNQHSQMSSSRKPAKTQTRHALDKKSGKFISIVLLIIAAALLITGANTIAGAARDIWGAGINRWPEFWLGVFYFIGGFISFFSRNIVTRRLGRYRNHYAFISGRGIVPISDIAQTAGLTVKAVKRDLQTMINSGYFEPGAYIDNELDCLVLSTEAAESARKSARALHEVTVQPDGPPENRYMAALAELRALNHTIADVAISGKIERIEGLAGKIFRIVEENPEKEPQIRRFVNYYLPTTFKLLRSYSMLEKQGIKGENIMAAKENISRVLDQLETGYEQQLDQLFQNDAMDIAADITVLENLMQQDGLAGDKSGFKTMTEGS